MNEDKIGRGVLAILKKVSWRLVSIHNRKDNDKKQNS